jgi:hypothetical protein
MRRYSRYQTVLLKLQALISYRVYTKSSATAGLFVIVGAFIERPRATNGRPYREGGSIYKKTAVLFTFQRFYGIIQLIDKLEFDEVIYVESKNHNQNNRQIPRSRH